MDCEHVFDVMDRCRRCGYQLTDAELREREYEALLDRREPRAASPGDGEPNGETGLF